MHHHYRMLFLTLAILWSLAAPARAGPLSYRQFVEHGGPASQTLDLPPLAGPAHVPAFTDAGLIRFAVHHHGSPILNDPAIEVQLYRAVAAVRDADPTRFDRLHPQLGNLLGNPDLFRYLLYRYDLAPARFARFHAHMIPELRGEALAMMIHQAPGTVPVGTAPGTPPAPGTSGNGPPPPVDLPGSPTVPAPPSVVLLFIGLGLAGLVRRKTPAEWPGSHLRSKSH